MFPSMEPFVEPAGGDVDPWSGDVDPWADPWETSPPTWGSTPNVGPARSEPADGWRRRSWMAEPGEPLLVPWSPVDQALRWSEFVERTGLAEGDLRTSTLIAVPWPRRLSGRPPAGTSPALAWHPLLWLPAELAGVEGDDDDLAAVRVALEVEAAGLYDSTTGTWLDVLSTVGLDSDSHADRQRVAAWLAGRPDPDLDRVDVAGLLVRGDDPGWAERSARNLIDSLYACSWAKGAMALALVADDIYEEAETSAGRTSRASAADSHSVAVDLAGIGAVWLSRTPELPVAGYDGQVSPSAALDLIRADLEALPAPLPLDELAAGPVSQIGEILVAVSEAWTPQMDRFVASTGTITDSAAPGQHDRRA